MKLSLRFFSPRDRIYGVGVEVGGGPGGPRDRRPRPRGGGRPLSRGQAVGPLALIVSQKILINSKKCLRGFPGHSENFTFLHIKQHHGSSAENSVSPALVSFKSCKLESKTRAKVFGKADTLETYQLPQA